MKIIDLRKKNIINLSISGVLLLIFGGGVFYDIHQRNNLQSKVDKIKAETLQIQNEATDLQSKAAELSKYKQLWTKISDNKKITNGIKMDEVNAKMTSIAEKYSILPPAIKVTLPETLKDGLFDRSGIIVLLSTVNITFNAASDTRALSFISEFIESLPGYTVITNLQIKKTKDYSNQDLIDLSSGKSSGAVSGNIDFYWYAFKAKEASATKSTIDIKKINAKTFNE